MVQTMKNLFTILKKHVYKILGIQFILNTFIIFFMLLSKDIKVLYIMFGLSLIFEIFGILILVVFACIKGSLVNVTNHKYLILDAKDMPKQ
jgi:hypothetical protein